jgi:hypothetical protein
MSRLPHLIHERTGNDGPEPGKLTTSFTRENCDIALEREQTNMSKGVFPVSAVNFAESNLLDQSEPGWAGDLPFRGEPRKAEAKIALDAAFAACRDR